MIGVTKSQHCLLCSSCKPLVQAVQEAFFIYLQSIGNTHPLLPRIPLEEFLQVPRTLHGFRTVIVYEKPHCSCRQEL